MSTSLWNTLIPSSVAAIAIIANTITTRATQKYQRETTHQDRLWRARSDVYVKLISLTLYKGGRPEDERLSEDLVDAAAEVHAFASEEVVDTFEGLLSASQLPSRDEDESYNRSERLGIQIDNLLSVVRDELHYREYSRPRSWLPLKMTRRRLMRRSKRTS